MKNKLLIFGLIIFTLSFLPADKLVRKAAAAEKPQVSEVISTTLEAQVTAVDQKKREVTLKGDDGKEVTIKVGEEVKNFSQVKVGDTLTVEYIASVDIEVMGPKAAEAGAAAVTSVSRAQPGEKPGGVASQAVVVVMTIEKIDKDKQMVTLKSADGQLTTVKPRNPENLDKVKVGDKIMITQTESIAISIAKKPVEKPAEKPVEKPVEK